MVWELEKCLTVSHETKYMHILWPTNSNPKYLPKINENKCPQKDLHNNVHSSFIPKSSKQEIALLSIIWRKHKLCFSHNGPLFKNRDTRQHRQVPKHCTEWKKSCVRSTYCIFPLIWSSRTGKLIFGEKKFRIMIASGWLRVESY